MEKRSTSPSTMPVSGFLSAGVLSALCFLLFPSPASAHEPGTIVTKLVSAPTSGGYLSASDPKGKGDTRVTWSFTNEDPDVDALLVFPVCGFEGDGRKREDLFQVGDLNGVLGGGAAVAGVVRLDPRWSVCQSTKSSMPGTYLLRRGTTLEVKQTLDFLPSVEDSYDEGASGPPYKIAVDTYFDVFVVDPQDSSELAAALASTRPTSGNIARYLKRATEGSRGDARQWLSLYYLLTPSTGGGAGAFLRTSYEELFWPTSLALDPEQGTGPGNHQVTDDAKYLFALDDYRQPKRILPDQGQLVYDPYHGDLREIDTTTDGPEGAQVCKNTRPDCAANPFADGCFCSGAAAGVTTGACFKANSTMQRGPSSTVTVSGRYSSMWTDHALHPAWGWRAVAWWNDGGTWKQLASDWVQWDGSYQLVINYPNYTGQHLQMQFRAYNNYYEPRTASDGLFRWKNPDRYNVSATHDEGHWYADTDGGDANGIGEMYRAGYLLWSRLYWDGDISPMRATPLKVYFPNTSYDCGNGSGVAWSCARYDGVVWLIAAHGVQADVVQHEFAHQVNYEFWDNRLPNGSCLSHSLCSNYNIGLALSEGYADFMPAWVGCGRGDTTCTASAGSDIETTAVCGTTKENEWNVAQTFEDLWDSHADGNDVLWYNHEGSVHKIFLANGPASGNQCGSGGPALGILNFKSIYDSSCSPGHGTYVDQIFDQNVQ